MHPTRARTNSHSRRNAGSFFTREAIFDVNVDPDGVISDHSFITWRLKFMNQPPKTVWNEIRCWKRVDHSEFQQALHDLLFETYDAVLRKLAGRFAPSKKVKIQCQPIANRLPCGTMTNLGCCVAIHKFLRSVTGMKGNAIE